MKSHLLLPVLLILLATYFIAQMWVGESTVPGILQVDKAIAEETVTMQQMQERNNQLFQQIKSLKTGREELEARARLELGMIKPGEVFYELPPKSAS